MIYSNITIAVCRVSSTLKIDSDVYFKDQNRLFDENVNIT